jgi:hypothetical protein
MVSQRCKLAVRASTEGRSACAWDLCSNARDHAYAISDFDARRAAVAQVNAVMETLVSRAAAMAAATVAAACSTRPLVEVDDSSSDEYDEGDVITLSSDDEDEHAVVTVRKRPVGPASDSPQPTKLSRAAEHLDDDDDGFAFYEEYPIPGKNGNSELHKKCFEGDLQGVLQLVASGADVMAQNRRRQTPLYFACKGALCAPTASAFLAPDEPSCADTSAEAQEARRVIGQLQDHMLSLARGATMKRMTAMCLLSWVRTTNGRRGFCIPVDPEVGPRWGDDDEFVGITTELLLTSLGDSTPEALDRIEVALHGWTLREFAARAEGVVESVVAGGPGSAERIAQSLVEDVANVVDGVSRWMWEKAVLAKPAALAAADEERARWAAAAAAGPTRRE